MNIRLHNIKPIGSNKCEKVWGLKKSGEPIRVWTPCMGWGKRCTARRSALLLLICLASASSEVKRDTCTHAGVWGVGCLLRTLNEPECPISSPHPRCRGRRTPLHGRFLVILAIAWTWTAIAESILRKLESHIRFARHTLDRVLSLCDDVDLSNSIDIQSHRIVYRMERKGVCLQMHSEPQKMVGCVPRVDGPA
jgi:hypothetical protein